MGIRSHGTWAPMHEDVHDHAKTLRLAKTLVDLGVPEEWASDVVVGQLHRLACWCLRDSASGRVGHLTPLRFAQVVRWPHIRTANRLWDAWMDSGFVDDARTEGAMLHEFEEYFWHVLRKRSGDGPAPSRRPSGARPAPVRRNSGDGPAPFGRLAQGRARASPEIGNRTHTQTGPGVCEKITKSDEPERAEPPSETPPDDATLSSRAQDFADEPDERLLAAWNAARAAKGLPPDLDGPKVREAWTALLTAVESDEELALATIAAYYALTDSYVCESGYSVSVFPFRVAPCVAKARESIDRRRRSNRTAQVASEPGEVPLGAGEAKARMATLPWKRGAKSEEDVAAENRRRAEAAERVRAEVAGGA